MKVLITCEQRSYVPIIEYHYLGICAEAEVICATDPFWTSNLKFDIIHIHWPEQLVDYRIHLEDVLEMLDARIRFWKSIGTKMVITRHNLAPHLTSGLKPEVLAKIYHLIYSSANAIVHLGQYSYDEFASQNIYQQAKNVIVRHANYLYKIENTVSIEDARKKFNLPKDSLVFCAFGEIRHEEEEMQVIEAFKQLKADNKYLLIPKSLFIKNKPGKATPVRYLKHILKQKINNSNKIIQEYTKTIDDKNIQYYMNAANIIISPRINNLNSGIIFLALSYEKVVIGPNIGNITETLEAIGYPTFIPEDNESLCQAMSDAKQMLDKGVEQKTLKYIEKEGDIYTIGKKLINLYKSL